MKRPSAVIVAVVLLLTIGSTLTTSVSVAAPVGAPAPTASRTDHLAKVAVRRAYCHGVRATIVGTRHGELLVGTSHRDVIAGGGGRDAILGRGGRDLICGGRGADILNAQGGRRQRLFGGAGQDFCIAGRPADHRFHHGCEVHLPDAPQSARASGAKRAPGAGAVAAAPGPAVARVREAARLRQARRAALSAQVGAVNCDSGILGVNANSDDPTLLSGGGAGFPDPTVVRVLPYVFSWNGSWVPRGNLEAKDFAVPNDGAFYNVGAEWDMTPQYWLVYFAYGWWDGGAWHWTEYTPVSDYRGFGAGSSGFCATVPVT